MDKKQVWECEAGDASPSRLLGGCDLLIEVCVLRVLAGLRPLLFALTSHVGVNNLVVVGESFVGPVFHLSD
jgi:hypothetical protein